MSEMGAGLELVNGVLGIVDEEVDSLGQLHDRGVVFAQAVGPRAGVDGTVAGDVGERRKTVSDAIAIHPASLVRHLDRPPRQTFDPVLAATKTYRAPAPTELAGRDRELVRRR